MARARDFLDLAKMIDENSDMHTAVEAEFGSPVSKDVAQRVSNHLAQLECMQGHLFAEPDTLSPLFLASVPQALDLDVDYARKLSLSLASLRQTSTVCIANSASVGAANVFTEKKQFEKRNPAAGGAWQELFWFRDAAGTAFLSRWRETAGDAQNLQTFDDDPKATAAAAIVNNSRQTLEKLQSLIAVLAVLHLTIQDEGVETRTKDAALAMQLAAQSVRDEFQWKALKSAARQQAFLHERIFAEMRERIQHCRNALSLGARASLARQRDVDIAVACELESKVFLNLEDEIYTLGSLQRDVVRSATLASDEYEEDAAVEAELFHALEKVVEQQGRVANCANGLRFPSYWPPYLVFQENTIRTQFASLLRLCQAFDSDAEEENDDEDDEGDEDTAENKEETKPALEAGGICIQMKNMAWFGKLSLHEMGEDWGGAGVIPLLSGKVLLPSDDGVLPAARWIGGGREDVDVSWFATAVREICEETLGLGYHLSVQDVTNTIETFCKSNPSRCSVAIIRDSNYPKPYIVLVLVLDGCETGLCKLFRQLPESYAKMDKEAFLTALSAEERKKHEEQAAFLFATPNTVPHPLSAFWPAAASRALQAANAKLFLPKNRADFAKLQIQNQWQHAAKSLSLNVSTLAGGLSFAAWSALLADPSAAILLPKDFQGFAGGSVNVITQDGRRLSGGASNVWVREGWAGLEVCED